jgi:dnd system-associated protein 4
MAAIRMPEAGAALLQYCNAYKNRKDDAFFPTYAHLILFAASIGYKRDEFDSEINFFPKEPYPIDIDIFKNLQLYDYILIIGLAKTKSYEIVNDNDELARIIEGFSSAGFREMLRVYDQCSGHNYIDEWVQHIISSQEMDIEA